MTQRGRGQRGRGGMGRSWGGTARGRGRAGDAAGKRRMGGAVAKLAGPRTGFRTNLRRARLNARTRPQPNPTDRYSGLGLGPDARGQPNPPAASQIASEGGKQTEKKDKTENADGGGRRKPFGLYMDFFALEKGRKGKRRREPTCPGGVVLKRHLPSAGARRAPLAGSGARGTGKQLHPPGGAPGGTRPLRLRACPSVCTGRAGAPGRLARTGLPGTRHKGAPDLAGLARFAAVQCVAPGHPGERRICAHTRIFKK